MSRSQWTARLDLQFEIGERSRALPRPRRQTGRPSQRIMERHSERHSSLRAIPRYRRYYRPIVSASGLLV